MGMPRIFIEAQIRSKRIPKRKSIVGATNRRLLKDLEVSSPPKPRPSNTKCIEAYQKGVIEAAKLKAASRRQLQQQSKTDEGHLVEPYLPNENHWMVMSYEVDIKADAVNRLNYIVRRLQAQAARRGRQLFRPTGTPRVDDDHDNGRKEALPSIPTAKSIAAAPGDMIVTPSIMLNPSVIPANEAFITSWTASTSLDRIYDPSMTFKRKMTALHEARSRTSHKFQKRLDKYAALQEQAAIEKDRRLLQQKGALQRDYQETLARQMAMMRTCIRKGLGECNSLALPQLKEKITSVWGTLPAIVVEELCSQDR